MTDLTNRSLDLMNRHISLRFLTRVTMQGSVISYMNILDFIQYSQTHTHTAQVSGSQYELQGHSMSSKASRRAPGLQRGP